jgi:hypothetical protein
MLCYYFLLSVMFFFKFCEFLFNIMIVFILMYLLQFCCHFNFFKYVKTRHTTYILSYYTDNKCVIFLTQLNVGRV